MREPLAKAFGYNPAALPRNCTKARTASRMRVSPPTLSPSLATSVTPDGEFLPSQPQIDNALVKALARTHCWKWLMEAGQYSNLTELERFRF